MITSQLSKRIKVIVSRLGKEAKIGVLGGEMGLGVGTRAGDAGRP